MPVNSAYLLGAIRDILVQREARIVDGMVIHGDANQLDPMMVFMSVARISELRGLRRDLEREARQEIDRMGEAHGAQP